MEQVVYLYNLCFGTTYNYIHACVCVRMVRINDPSSPASKHPSVKTVVACHGAVSFDQWFVLYHACGQCLLLDPASVRGSKHGACFFFWVHVLISYCAAHKLQLAAALEVLVGIATLADQVAASSWKSLFATSWLVLHRCRPVVCSA